MIRIYTAESAPGSTSPLGIGIDLSPVQNSEGDGKHEPQAPEHNVKPHHDGRGDAWSNGGGDEIVVEGEVVGIGQEYDAVPMEEYDHYAFVLVNCSLVQEE